MATRLRNKSFQRNLLFSIGGIFLLFAVCFSGYQYKREKAFKIDILHARLQLVNYRLMQSLDSKELLDKRAFNAFVDSCHIEGLRMTVIDSTGKVLIDSSGRDAERFGDHSGRVEIASALRDGEGYSLKRTSVSTHETYFYSATRLGDIVVRAAVPYSTALARSLQVNNTYLYFLLALTLLLGFTLYYNTSRIGRHIGYLREFAIKAEEGEELDHELERAMPDDELGDISHTVIALYWKLRHSEEDKVRLKRQLTQNAAHELKTPAASIHGYLESIIEHPHMPADKRQHFLERCYAQSERMNKLLLDMATLTKLDESPLLTHNRPATMVDVVELIHSILDELSLDLKRHAITPVLQLPQEIAVMGDRSVLYSIFRNIIDNSLAYATGADRITITCKESGKADAPSTVRPHAVKGYYEFTVADNGQGVELEHLPHLFERFYRVDKGRSRKAGGTGLGLAIVKNAVAVHGGTATAETTPGGGLTIRFTLERAL